MSPTKDEKKDAYIARFMKDPAMVDKHPEEKKRMAACESKWADHVKALDEQLNFADMNKVEIFKAGTYYGETYDETKIDDIAKNTNDLIGTGKHRAPAKLGHSDAQEYAKQSGLPALGWVKRVYREGQKLYADFRDVPQVVIDAIQKRAYDSVSSEIYMEPASLKEFGLKGLVLRAVAFLGADVPKVKGMMPLSAFLDERDGKCFLFSSSDTMEFGGQGSGNWGHSGIPGQVGGSSSGGGGGAPQVQPSGFKNPEIDRLHQSIANDLHSSGYSTANMTPEMKQRYESNHVKIDELIKEEKYGNSPHGAEVARKIDKTAMDIADDHKGGMGVKGPGMSFNQALEKNISSNPVLKSAIEKNPQVKLDLIKKAKQYSRMNEFSEELSETERLKLDAAKASEEKRKQEVMKMTEEEKKAAADAVEAANKKAAEALKLAEDEKAKRIDMETKERDAKIAQFCEANKEALIPALQPRFKALASSLSGTIKLDDKDEDVMGAFLAFTEELIKAKTIPAGETKTDKEEEMKVSPDAVKLEEEKYTNSKDNAGPVDNAELSLKAEKYAEENKVSFKKALLAVAKLESK